MAAEAPAGAPAAPGAEDDATEQAAEWIVRLGAVEAAERAEVLAGFAAWKRIDPRHAAAARRLEGFVGLVEGLRRDQPEGAKSKGSGGTVPARSALDAAWKRRAPVRRVAAALAVAAVLAAPGWLLLDAFPPSHLLADIHTRAGGWESRTLSDGSRVTMRGTAAANLRFDDAGRGLELLDGEILVEVAPDAARPFRVRTAEAVVRALGTRFIVRRTDGATVLTMLESRAAASARADRGGGETVVAAGQRVRIGADGVGPPEPVDARSIADAWRKRQLVVDARPLPEVLHELARHRPGYIRYDADALAGYLVSAVLPLDDTDRALRLLVTSFPAIRVRTVTPWLVLVDAPGPG